MSTEIQNKVALLSQKVKTLQRRVNRKEVLVSNGPISGNVGDCCYSLGIDIDNGNLYYVDENGDWQLHPTAGGGGDVDEIYWTFANGTPTDPPPVGYETGYHLDVNTGDIYYWNGSTWTNIYTPGAGINQDLEDVLLTGNTAANSITLYGIGSNILVGDTGLGFGRLDQGHLFLENASGWSSTIETSALTSNVTHTLPNQTGTFALLSDLPTAGPLTINNQSGASYTLQLSDGDNNTLVKMTSASPNSIVIDGSIAFPIGTSIMVGTAGGGLTTVSTTGSAVLLTPGGVASTLELQYGGAVLIKVSSTEWYMWGDVGTPVPGLEDVIVANNSLTADRTIALGSNAISFDNGKVNIGTTTSVSGKVLNVVGDTIHRGDVYLDDVGTLNGNSQSLYFKGQTTLGNYQNGRIYYDSHSAGGSLVLYNDQSSSTASLFNFGLQLSSGRLDTVNTAGLKLTCSSLTSGISLSNGYNQSSGNIFSITNNTSGAPQSIMSITYDGIPKINRLSTSLAAPTTSGTTKMVITDANGTLSWANVAGGGDALTASPLSQFAATTSAQLAGVISDETGSGALVFATSPTLVTPDLGTPSAAVLTNATGLPISGLTGLGSGIGTWLGTPSSANLAAAITDETGTGSLVFSNSPTLVTPALGTPSSLTLTNATGLPISGLTGLGSGISTWLGTPSSANLASAITDETGTGSLVFNTNPVFGTKITTPLILGGTSTTQTMTFQTTSGNATTGADFIWLGGNNGATTLMTLTAAGLLITSSTAQFGNIISTGSVIRASSLGWFDWGAAKSKMYSPNDGEVQITSSSGTAKTATLITGGLRANYLAKTTTYTITVTDYTIDCTTGTFTVTLPTAVGIAGQEFIIKNTGTGTITIATTSSQTIDGVTSKTLTTQYSGLRVQSTGSNWIVIGTI